MSKNAVVDLALSEVMRPEIALSLQHVLKIYTVGNLLNAWRSPRSQRSIEQIFDSPDQARHALAVLAAWLGVQTRATHDLPAAWWPHEEQIALGA